MFSLATTSETIHQKDYVQEVLATCKRFSQLKDSSYFQAENITRLCTIFGKLSKAAHQHQIKSDIHTNFHRLVQCIFGGNGFVGLHEVVDSLKEYEVEEASELLCSSITPGGDFFKLVMLLQKEDYIYYIPAESIPLALFFKDYYGKQMKLPMFLKERTITRNSRWKVRLSACELYIYYALTYSLRSDELSPLAQKASPFFTKCLQRLLVALFPTEASAFEKFYSLNPYFRSNQGIDNSLPRFFLDMFLETWLKVDGGLVKPSPYCSQAMYPSIVPSTSGLSLIRQVCLHFQSGLINFLPERDDTQFSLQLGFWQSIYLEFQPRLFHYLKAVFNFQTFTPELISVVEIWLDYITPWDFLNFKDFSKCEFYIADNFLFYKELLLDFLYRCLESQYLSESLGRYAVLSQSEVMLQKVLSMFCDDRVLKVLGEADVTLNGLTFRSKFPFSFCPGASEVCFSFDMAGSERFAYALETHIKRFRDSPVFNNPIVSSPRWTDWKQGLYDVFLNLARLCSSESQFKRFETETSIPTHRIYDSIREFLSGLFSFYPKKKIILTHDNYLTAQEYQTIAGQISKLFKIEHLSK